MPVRLFITMFKRSIREVRRIIVVVIAVPLIVPIFVLTVFAQVFTSVIRIPGFEGRASYVTYLAPAALLMSVMLSGTAAVSVAVERQSGFYDRMRISPAGVRVSNTARRAADAVKVGVFALVLIVVSRLSGAHVASWPGVLAVGFILPALWGFAYGGLAFATCVRLGRPEVSEAILPLFFPLLFMSSAFLPLKLLPGWMQGIARYNPLTYIANTIRDAYSGTIGGANLGWSLVGIAAVAAATQVLLMRAEARAATA
jgi:ABC-2 type transport system permease protein